MPAGQTFDRAITSVGNNGFLDIQPGLGVEAIIKNVYCGGTWELYKSDGTNQIKIDDGIAGVGPVSMAIHVTNTRYLRVKNISGAAALFSADGMQIV